MPIHAYMEEDLMMPDPKSLLPLAYKAASRVVRSRILAEEAGERAFHLLTLAMLQGCPPSHPEAWLRVVARRSACAILRSEWARTQAIDFEEVECHEAPFREPRTIGADTVRERLQASLSPRQRDAFEAALSCNTTRAAARRCGMQPRDFRRSLGAISRKAKVSMADRASPDRYADDVGVQFRLSR
jgi:DNA-directed RNA polymerase specialized sigma24 family protein